MTEPDDSLVHRSRSGDRAAFEELVRRTSRALYARLYLDIADVHRAEDLVQETYLRAWRSIGTLSDVKTFRGWLHAIADRVVIDAARRDGAKKRQDDPAMFQPLHEEPSPHDSIAQQEQREKVVAILKSLPPEYRDVLTLRYLAGADYQTIGKQLSISNGSLRGLLHRGLKLLREKYKP